MVEWNYYICIMDMVSVDDVMKMGTRYIKDERWKHVSKVGINHKLTILILLWILDKLIMLGMFLIFKN